MMNRLLLCAILAAAAVPGAASSQTPQLEASAPTSLLPRTGVARSGALTIPYEVHGDLASTNRPLLVLHGAYMSADAMAAFVSRFSRSRAVIVFDQRGHGRTGDADGSITYEAMADDAAAVLEAASIEQADVFGYSMGGSTAMQLAIRHPGRVGKLISVSAGSRLDAIYPEVLEGIAGISASVFDNTPIRREYDRLAPRPQDFPLLVQKLKVLDATPYDWTDALRNLRHKTMIVMGDYDILSPEHAVEIFRIRGGGAADVAAQGFLTSPPPARLLVLPAASHIGVMAEADAIVGFALPFLDDTTPRMPDGFF